MIADQVYNDIFIGYTEVVDIMNQPSVTKGYEGDVWRLNEKLIKKILSII